MVEIKRKKEYEWKEEIIKWNLKLSRFHELQNSKTYSL